MRKRVMYVYHSVEKLKDNECCYSSIILQFFWAWKKQTVSVKEPHNRTVGPNNACSVLTVV